MVADIIPFPAVVFRRENTADQKKPSELVDCLFGEIDLFRLLCDTEEKVLAMRQENDPDFKGSP